MSNQSSQVPADKALISNEARFQIELDVEEDIPQDAEHFTRLSKRVYSFWRTISSTRILGINWINSL